MMKKSSRNEVIIKNENFLRNLFTQAYNSGLVGNWGFKYKIGEIENPIERTVCRDIYFCGEFDRNHHHPTEDEKRRIFWLLIGKNNAVKQGIQQVKFLLKKEAKIKKEAKKSGKRIPDFNYKPLYAYWN